mmetsp:Transcript_7826/g.18185  ORF Transcript_7826/g.18185 Transcript_7826/m.18185 type:complete len:263 (+) Transcript_7826:72-860(+)
MNSVAPSHESLGAPRPLDIVKLLRDGISLYWEHRLLWLFGVLSLFGIRFIWSFFFNYGATALTYRMMVEDGVFDFRLWLTFTLLELISGAIDAPCIAGFWFAGVLAVTDPDCFSLGVFLKGFNIRFFPRVYILYALELAYAVIARQTFGRATFWLEGLAVASGVYLSWFTHATIFHWPDTELFAAIKLSVFRVLSAGLPLFLLDILTVGALAAGVISIVGIFLVIPVAVLTHCLAFLEIYNVPTDAAADNLVDEHGLPRSSI